ncbi:SPOR domain-containing protein [Pseudooceanicola sp.]|uniref:SPOR domain-containing protein n=1 Tax=Pseudooceanicola sp. TaxID=1914328 RepID=UPI0040591181
MAEIQVGSGQDPSFSVATLINLAGGLASVGLLVGVGIWGYQTVMRDVSEVPVVRAAQDPMRVAPDDPGGTLAGNMGLAVNKVAASGVAEKPADRLILAPAPVSLTIEDEPRRVLEEMLAAEARVVEMATSGAPDEDEAGMMGEEGATPSPPIQTPPSETVQSDDPTLVLTAALLEGAKPLSGEVIEKASADSTIAKALMRAQESAAEQSDTSTAIAVLEAEPVAPQPVAFRPQNKRLPARSLRPRMRPGVASPSGPAAMIAAPLALQPSLDVDPTTITPGTRLAQLGAYDSTEKAMKEWDRFTARFGDYMDGKQRVIQKASSGGRTFYRLRVMGFDDLSAARYFCAALVAENADCIPVVSK